MDRQATLNAIRRAAKGKAFIKVGEVANALGVQSETAQANYLCDLEYLPSGRAKLYLIEDVVDAILAKKEIM